MTRLVRATSTIMSNKRSMLRHNLVHVQGLSEAGIFLCPAVTPQLTAHQTQPLLSPLNTPNQDIIPRCAAWLPRATLDFHVRGSDEGTEAAGPTSASAASEYQRAAPAVSEHGGAQKGRRRWRHCHERTSAATRQQKENHRRKTRMGKHSGCSG